MLEEERRYPLLVVGRATANGVCLRVLGANKISSPKIFGTQPTQFGQKKNTQA